MTGGICARDIMIIIDETLQEKDIVTQPGKKDKERGLMEPRLEGDGTGWRKKKDVLSSSD